MFLSGFAVEYRSKDFSTLFSQLLVLINTFLLILNFWVDIWFLADNLESNYSLVTTFKVQWLLREIYWKRVRQIGNRTDRCQMCFFPLLSDIYPSEHRYIIPQLLRKATEAICLCKSKDMKSDTRNIFLKYKSWKERELEENSFCPRLLYNSSFFLFPAEQKTLSFSKLDN